MKKIYLILFITIIASTTSCEKEVSLNDIPTNNCMMLYSTDNGQSIVDEYNLSADIDHYSMMFGNINILGHSFDGVNGIFITEAPIAIIGPKTFGNSLYHEYMTSITVPNSVRVIGEEAFSQCHNLHTVYCKPTTPPKSDNFGYGFSRAVRCIYVPMQSRDAYIAAEGWKKYADKIVGYDF